MVIKELEKPEMESIKDMFDDIKIREDTQIISLPIIGPKRIPEKMAESLYRQNRNKYKKRHPEWVKDRWMRGIGNGTSFEYPDLIDLKSQVLTIDKYTIVELIVGGKHYHGLTAKADCDRKSDRIGISYAYNRAFVEMINDWNK